MIKPHIVKYLDKIKFVVSTIKEQTTSEIGQIISRRETVGEEVDSLIPRPPIDLTTSSEIGDNWSDLPTPSTRQTFNSDFDSPVGARGSYGLLDRMRNQLSTPSSSQRTTPSSTPSPESITPRFLTFAQVAAQNPVDAQQMNYPRTVAPIPITSAQRYASEVKRRKNNDP